MQVLLVMSDQSAAAELSKTLSAKGHTSQFAEGGFYALTMLERNKPDAILSSADVVDMSGFDFYEIIRSDESLNAVVFLLLDDDKRDQLTHGKDLSLPPNASADAIVAALTQGPASSPFKSRAFAANQGTQVSGTLEVLTLFDLIMSLTQNGRSGKLFLLIDDKEAVISIVEGQVVHAQFGDELGEAALKDIFFQSELTNNTEFLFEAKEPSEMSVPSVTIKASVKELLFRVAVDLDHFRNTLEPT